MKTSTRIARHLSRNWFDYDEATKEYRYQVNIDWINVVLNLTEVAEGWQTRSKLHYHVNWNGVGYFSWYFCSYDLWLAWVVRIVKDLVDRFQRETE